MASYYTDSNQYSYIWSKYRPAILKLMVDSKDSPQQYKFSNHEFLMANPTEKRGYSFKLRVFQSKAVNDIKTSSIAKDLLRILQQSRKATELTEHSIFEFEMEKGFTLKIAREEAIKITIMDDIKVPQSPFKPINRNRDLFKDLLDTYSVSHE